MDDLKVGILVVSDRCFSGTSKDESGVAIEAIVLEKLSSSAAITTKIVPDEQDQIKAALLAWVEEGISLILTTGGTGFAPRDVTPEATREVIEKEAPGLTMCMMIKSLEKTPHAMLSRAVAGIKGKTLIVNLPGSVKGATENLTAILPALPHGIKLMLDVKNENTKHSVK